MSKGTFEKMGQCERCGKERKLHTLTFTIVDDQDHDLCCACVEILNQRMAKFLKDFGKD